MLSTLASTIDPIQTPTRTKQGGSRTKDCRNPILVISGLAPHNMPLRARANIGAMLVSKLAGCGDTFESESARKPGSEGGK